MYSALCFLTAHLKILDVALTTNLILLEKLLKLDGFSLSTHLVQTLGSPVCRRAVLEL